MFEIIGTVLAVLLAIINLAILLIAIGVYKGKVDRVVNLHDPKCVGQELLERWSGFETKVNLFWKIFEKNAAFQLRDATTPRLDLLLDKTTSGRATLDDLHELESLLNTQINEGGKTCAAYGHPCQGQQLAAGMMKARVEAIIYDKTHPEVK